MQTRDFAGPFVDHNPDYTGVAWESYGASASHIDSDDATGYLSQDLTGEASVAHTMDYDDGTIPSTAEINSVLIRFRLGDDALATAAALRVLPYVRYAGGAPAFQELIAPAHAAAFTNFDTEFPRDPDGLPWARPSIYRKRGKLLRFGLRAAASEHPTARIKWSECLFRVSFTLAVPLVVTDPASLISGDNAVLNGRLNPQGANGTYPVTYYFEYGTTTEYGSQTTPVENITGDIDLAVSAVAIGLTGGQGYHFRLVAETADGPVYGGDQYFSTDVAGSGRFRLDEFKRIPTGTYTAADRTRITAFGFDRAAGFGDDCSFLEFP